MNESRSITITTPQQRNTGERRISPGRVFGIYPSAAAAERGVQRLLASSFNKKRIRVVFYDTRGPEPAPIRHRTSLPIGAIGGVILGGAAGAALSALGLVGVTAGVLAGAGLAGFAGALTGLVFWREEVEIPEDAEESGGVLVVVPAATESRRRTARHAMNATGAEILAT